MLTKYIDQLSLKMYLNTLMFLKGFQMLCRANILQKLNVKNVNNDVYLPCDCFILSKGLYKKTNTKGKTNAKLKQKFRN